MLTIKVLIQSLLLTLALIALRQNAFAQADTIPALLQCRITGSIQTYHFGNNPVYQLQYAAPNMVFASEGTPGAWDNNAGNTSFLHVSVDDGRSFISRDTLPEDYGIPKSYILYRIEENNKFQISRDTGKTWSTPEDLNTLSLPYLDQIDYSANGVRVSLGDYRSHGTDKNNYDLAYTSTNSGLAWNTSWWQDTTQVLIGGTEPLIRWADEQNGIIVAPNSYASNPNDTPPPTNAYIAVTSDGGISWRKVLQQGDLLYDILWFGNGFDVEYPFPSTIIMQSEYGNWVSLDTGRIWLTLSDTSPYYNQQIVCVTPDRWLAATSNEISLDLNYDYGGGIVPTISTDNGNTWNLVKYNGLNPITLMSFKDTLNGLASDGYDIVARTSDGGFTWETVDSSAYMYGHITHAFGLDSAYYAFSPLSDTIINGAYAFFTRDRGETWQNILDNQPGYAFAGLDSEYWVGGTGFARIASLYGLTGNTFIISNRDSTHITAIDKNFVWVSDANELYAAPNDAMYVMFGVNVAQNIPGYVSSDSYRFFPIDRNVVYVRAPDTVYATSDAGSNWIIAPAMPDIALDASHWFIFTSDTNSINYTEDGGQSFTTLTVPNANAHTILPIDSMRWYVNGFSTTDAGKSWKPIPGWDNKLGLYPVDATTAFGEPIANIAKTDEAQILWRLNLPFMPIPQAGVAEDEQQPETELIVFPNPATNAIQVTPATGGISILDPLGRIYVLPRTGNTLDISSLPSGVYFVIAGNERTKFVKE